MKKMSKAIEENKYKIAIKRLVSHSEKKCDIWCHKAYTDKNEKQVGCYVTLDGVETFSDT